MKRRNLLGSLLASLIGAAKIADARASGSAIPVAAPGSSSVVRISGDVRVNGAMATLGTQINAMAKIVTGVNSEIVFVLGTQALAMREQTAIEIQPAVENGNLFVAGAIRLVQGALSSVSRGSVMAIITTQVEAGLRGTGIHVSCNADETYFCTCYGTVHVAATANAHNRTLVHSKHHDRPLNILKSGRILPARFLGHTDEELIYLENLVGRKPPFVA